jgi:hypothetical protein
VAGAKQNRGAPARNRTGIGGLEIRSSIHLSYGSFLFLENSPIPASLQARWFTKCDLVGLSISIHLIHEFDFASTGRKSSTVNFPSAQNLRRA